MPKGSLSEVLRRLKQDGMIEIGRTISNRKIVKITQRGKQEYDDKISRSPEFKLTSAAEKYLALRGLAGESLFPVQLKFVERGLLRSKDNVAVFSHPGTGKTLVAEMAMADELSEGGKVLFCTPYRALDWQKYQDFSDSFGRQMQKTVVLSDGDSPVKVGLLDQADVIVATYERIHAAIRTGEPWLDTVTLVCVDELTHLGEDERGGVLDAVLTHLKQKPGRRVITLSSLVGNSIDIADWLKAEPVIENAPVKQIKEYVVYEKAGSIVFQERDGSKRSVDTSLDPISYILNEKLNERLTTLIFVGSRPQARQEADRFLSDEWIENTSLTKRLCEGVKRGIAFHHAGLQRATRRFVEQLLKDQKLRTIVATTTLSHGVDYRVDAVVIDLPTILKIRELRGYEYLNLMGRTGRPGLSLGAEVFILTEPRNLKKVLKKYFFGSPEEVLPNDTFDKESVASMVLAGARSGAQGELDILRILRETFRATRDRPGRKKITRLVNELSRLGFVLRNGSRFSLTPLGLRVLTSGLSPYDAVQLLKLNTNASDDHILDLASRIDLARRVRNEWRMNKKNVPGILNAWMTEVPLDRIRRRYGANLDDQDIIELAEYTARSLQKMADFVDDLELKQRIQTLQKRVKFGWLQDLANSTLGGLSMMVRNKNRRLARRMMKAGLGTLDEVSKQDSSTIAAKIGVSGRMAESLIRESLASVSKPVDPST